MVWVAGGGPQSAPCCAAIGSRRSSVAMSRLWTATDQFVGRQGVGAAGDCPAQLKLQAALSPRTVCAGAAESRPRLMESRAPRRTRPRSADRAVDVTVRLLFPSTPGQVVRTTRIP